MGFLNILQCILCCEEDEKLVIERNRYGYFEIVDRDDFVSYICSKLQWIRFRPTTTTNAARFHYENNQLSSNASSILSRDTTFKSSIPVKSPGIVEYNYRSIESGKNSIDHSNVIKRDHNPEKKVDKPFKFRDQNLKDSSSSSSTSSFVKTVQTPPFNPLKPIEEVQKRKGLAAQNVNSASSQESRSSFKFPVTLHSVKSPSLSSSSSSLLENLKGLAPVTSTPSSVKAVSTRPLEPQKSIDGCQKGKGLLENVSSATSRESQSSFKSLVASHLSKSSSASSLLERSPSPKPRPLSTKPTLLQTSSSTYQQGTTNYILVEGSTTYVFPEDIKSSIEKEIVPGVLKQPLSMSTYKNYFHALLYAEDCYLKKWDGFEMKNVNLELHNAEILVKVGYLSRYKRKGKDKKIFVAFEVGKNRPFLLSRDFISVKPSNEKGKEFQGIFYRLVGKNLLLAEFGDDFHSHHRPDCKYDVKFSFNRVCLKRAHHAIEVASGALVRNFLFPEFIPESNVTSMELFIDPKLDKQQISSLQHILSLNGSPPYLIEGPMSATETCTLSKPGLLIAEAVAQICRSSPSNRILICAPLNQTCDVLMRGLQQRIPSSDMFRANAAFRELDGVPLDILQSCSYEEEVECFLCPRLDELEKFQVILTTFISSFRLYAEGLKTGHFSHIFLVDASSATEPEAMVPLANFANDSTVVVITGTPKRNSGWIRSPIARNNGLKISYFERLRDGKLYRGLDPKVMTFLSARSDDTFGSFN
ncbi:unnamed protein product [Fraxinus pennsylvanica]|uniref:Helicase MOV-10-like beta-barrel domain-containing protein n=1 Tax=Fraxinus pennsylvanica TaxID=56036 RepID=A0AAD2AG41_9LAMI|nr:unnamed protein product [Fraxinus pennsylvanica]